jgi:hypothetical protein
MSRVFILLLGTIAVLGTPARGQMQLLNQGRSIEAAVERTVGQAFQEDVQDQAPDFGQWIAAVVARPTVAVGRIEAIASQNSSIQTNRLQATGAVRTEGDLMEGAEVLAVSEFRVQFGVASSINYRLSGFLTRSTRTPSVRVILDRSGGQRVFELEIGANDLELVLGQQGTLQTGVYELTVTGVIDSAVVLNSEFTRDASFVVQFDASASELCTADLDGDGDVDLVDYGVFQSSVGGPHAGTTSDAEEEP